ncbi:MAG: hypothetical protein FJY99_07630 [Candidatus Sericytochromatia bacterium]|nr:hypothetical protein [Candidatus Tanganyikabacteria bacterium]
MKSAWTDATQALREGRYDDALPVLLEASGGQLDRLRPLVRVLCTAGALPRAVDLVRGVLARGHAAAAEALANELLDAGHHEAAVYYLQAGAVAVLGRPETAIDLIRVGMAFDGDPGRAQAELALLLVSMGRHAEAVEAFASAPMDRAPVRWREGQGLALAMIGRQAEARAVFEGILAEEPGHPLATRALTRLQPMRQESMAARLRQRVSPRARPLYDRLLEGPATEADFVEALRAAGQPATLVQALIRDMARTLTFGRVSLLVAREGLHALDWSLLDLEEAR